MRPPGWRSGLTVAAVFWALAVGMALGAGAVSSRMVDLGLLGVVENRLEALEARLVRVSGELGRARRDLALYRQAAQELLPQALAGRMPEGLEVTLQATPGARRVGEQLAQLLSQAGAAVRVQAPPSGGKAEWVALRTPGAVVVGLMGSTLSGPADGAGPGWPAAFSSVPDPRGVSSPTPPQRLTPGPQPAAPAAVAWVDGIDEPLGMLAAVEALLSCPRGRVVPEEALIRLARRGRLGTFQRDRACLAGGAAHRPDRGGAAPP